MAQKLNHLMELIQRDEKDKDKEKDISKIVKPGHLSPEDSFDIEGPDGSMPSNLDIDQLDQCNGGCITPRSTASSGNLQLPGMSLRTASIRVDDATETLDELKFEEELEGGDEDRFVLSDIIWSITHKDNTDKDARAIILLCFPTFSDSFKLLKCLIERFFEIDESKLNGEGDPSSTGAGSSRRESSVSISESGSIERTNSGTHSPKSSTMSKFDFEKPIPRIESLWEVQVKVVSFLQQWMRTYWKEDWDDNDRMLEIVEQFCIKIETCYRNDPTMNETDVKRGMKLIKMIHQTMDFQEASIKSQKRKTGTALTRQGSVPRKFEVVSDMSSAVSKMRYDFVKLDNRRLAEQITLLDFKYFRAIQSNECLGQSWKKK